MDQCSRKRLAMTNLAAALLLIPALASAGSATRIEVSEVVARSSEHSGQYALEVIFEDDFGSAYVFDDTPDQEVSYRARFTVLPSSASSGTSGNVHTLFAARGGGQDIFVLECRANPEEPFEIRARVRRESGEYYSSSWEDITTGWVTVVEFEWEAGAGSDDGHFVFWINDSPVFDANVDNDFQVIDQVRLGAVTSQSIEGSVFLDDFESSAPSQAPFQISSYIPSASQRFASPVGSPTGEFIVAWESYDGLDGDGYAIHARRFDENGDPAGFPFQVNSYTTSHQKRPAATGLSEGEPDHFLVTWSSEYGQDGDDSGIFARAYDERTALGSDFQVNTYTPYDQASPSAAADASGEVVIVWNSVFQDGHSWGVFGRRVSFDGSPIGSEFQVNTYTTSAQLAEGTQHVARADDGDFVVAWTSLDGQDGDGSGVFAQRFSATAAPVGSEFQVNTYTTYGQGGPAVAMNPTGEFLVVWTSVGQDGSGGGVFGQLFEADGDPAGSEFQVNTDWVGSQGPQSVAVTENGDWVVVWWSYGGLVNGNKARIYSSAGTALTPELRVDKGGLSSTARVASLDGDSFLATFHRRSCTGCANVVFGQKFRIPLFADDFETGSLKAWSGFGS